MDWNGGSHLLRAPPTTLDPGMQQALLLDPLRQFACTSPPVSCLPWVLTQLPSLHVCVGVCLYSVGGFSYADVLDSAKGWAATIRFNERVLKQFQEFYNRPDTFSLGICNGCQLQALLGWVPATASADGGVAAQLPDLQQPRFVHNTSGRCDRQQTCRAACSCQSKESLSV